MFSKNDGEGTGVEPDVKVNEADALDVAEKLALSKLQKIVASPGDIEGCTDRKRDTFRDTK